MSVILAPNSLSGPPRSSFILSMRPWNGATRSMPKSAPPPFPFMRRSISSMRASTASRAFPLAFGPQSPPPLSIPPVASWSFLPMIHSAPPFPMAPMSRTLKSLADLASLLSIIFSKASPMKVMASEASSSNFSQ